MGSQERYYRRRLQEESAAERRAITDEARLRRQSLIETFRHKLAEIEAQRSVA